MDKKKSFLNIFFSLFFKIIIMVLSLYSRKFIIKYLGNELNGLSSLYQSIIGVLCVVELGIGSAITFSMYKPIIENDIKKVNALYSLYKKLYFIVGLIILFFGIIMMPFLPQIAKDYTVDLHQMCWGYAFYLISIVLTYFYSAKISLINAHKNNYVSSIITSSCQVLLYILQIVVLPLFKSFIIFNFIRIITTAICLITIGIYTKKFYFDKICGNNQIDNDEKEIISKNIRAMFYHKIGAELVNTSDNIIISAILGVQTLGYYSNYSTLCVSMIALLNLIFTSLTSIVGHFYVQNNPDKIEKYYKFFHTINFIIGTIFFLCFYGVIDQFILNFYEKDVNLILERKIVLIITINYFIQFFRKATLMFKDATGVFYNDRYVPILEGIINIILSLILAYFWGLIGVIIATIITNLFICYVFEPLILYKYAFKKNGCKFLIKNYIYTALFIILIMVFDLINFIPQTNDIKNFFLNGFYAALIGFLFLFIILLFDKNFKNFLLEFINKRKKKKAN